MTKPYLCRISIIGVKPVYGGGWLSCVLVLCELVDSIHYFTKHYFVCDLARRLMQLLV